MIRLKRVSEQNIVWDSAEAIPTKLKTPLLSHQPMTAELR